jgi:hypothetical protein
MEFEQKKMAIAQGLMPFLRGESLADALRLWEAKYSREPTFALARFISELSDSGVLTAPYNKVLRSLFRALNNPSVTAPAQGARAPIVENPGANDDAIRACALLVDTLIDRLPQDKGQSIRQYMLERLERLQQPAPVLNTIRAWLSQRETIAMPIPETALTRIVNLAYVAVCEYLGPTKADQALHEAVLIVEKATAGSRFSVRRLL